MPQKWLRPVAYFGLVAFLIATTPASGSMSWVKHETCQCPGGARDGCLCEEAGCDSSSEASTPDMVAVSRARPTHDQVPPCPCCPCRGGCAYCCVAKVPCHLATTSPTPPALCLGQGLAETSFRCPPPHIDRLIRPPRD